MTVPDFLHVGSSPLTRGKRDLQRHRDRIHRLIPTHAGKTRGASCPPWPEWAHPHSRGENMAIASSSSTMRGSSPLTRGKRPGRTRPAPRRRLIPTHPGKTNPANRPTGEAGAHPHSRGENSNRRYSEKLAPGSSPLTRGKRRRGAPRGRRIGLIPTHAGKTGTGGSKSTSPRAHPHSRGENQHQDQLGHRPHGSSPLTRGKLLTPRLRIEGSGLIPTHAGKTLGHASVATTQRAHPHSRGENRAGSPSGTRRAAHPHSRGENVVTQRQDGDLTGSSPLTRGKHLQAHRIDPQPGLIPTHAGKTRSRR